MPWPLSFPARFSDPFDDATVLTFIGTVAAGVVTKVRSSPGLTCGNFTAGVAPVTLPKCRYAVHLSANENASGATPATNHMLKTDTFVPSAGTASLRSALVTDGTLEAPANGTFTFAVLVTF